MFISFVFSSQPSPSQQINLGPSSNPSAKPSDFHFLKVIGKGSFGKVLLARHRTDDQFYAVKVLQKKAILKKKEVRKARWRTRNPRHGANMSRVGFVSTSLTFLLLFVVAGETHHVGEECAPEECQASVLGGAALLLPDGGQALLRLGLHQRRRGELFAEHAA